MAKATPEQTKNFRALGSEEKRKIFSLNESVHTIASRYGIHIGHVAAIRSHFYVENRNEQIRNCKHEFQSNYNEEMESTLYQCIKCDHSYVEHLGTQMLSYQKEAHRLLNKFFSKEKSDEIRAYSIVKELTLLISKYGIE